MTAKSDQIGAVDRYVGYRVQLRRVCSGIERDQIAGKLGITLSPIRTLARHGLVRYEKVQRQVPDDPYQPYDEPIPQAGARVAFDPAQTRIYTDGWLAGEGARA